MILILAFFSFNSTHRQPFYSTTKALPGFLFSKSQFESLAAWNSLDYDLTQNNQSPLGLSECKFVLIAQRFRTNFSFSSKKLPNIGNNFSQTICLINKGQVAWSGLGFVLLNNLIITQKTTFSHTPIELTFSQYF